MSAFEDQLNRLKLVLEASDDQEVAAALGMTKAAFSARKNRESFPVDKLKALAADRPELRLDVKYILTGISDELERRLHAVKTATKIASRVKDKPGRYAVQAEVHAAIVGALSADEQQLVHCFRRADARGKALMLATGVTVAGDEAPARPKAAHKRT